MKDKHDYLSTFGVDTDEDIAKTLAMFGGFTEGLQLFASFAMLMNFPRFNKMKGMGQIVSWSVRDESLHCEGIIKLFHTFVKERDCLTKSVKDDILDVCQKTVRLEDAFIDLAFEQGPVNGMTPKEIKKYIRYIADWRLGQLGFAPIYMVDEHPLPWLAPLLNGVEHANFFETRATEYSKARDPRELERGLGQFRPPHEGEGGRGSERRSRCGWRRAGYVRGVGGGGGVKHLLNRRAALPRGPATGAFRCVNAEHAYSLPANVERVAVIGIDVVLGRLGFRLGVLRRRLGTCPADLAVGANHLHKLVDPAPRALDDIVVRTPMLAHAL